MAAILHMNRKQDASITIRPANKNSQLAQRRGEEERVRFGQQSD
jgi:hypothetical protein